MIYKDAEVLAQMLYSLSMFALHSVADSSGSVDAQVEREAACVPAVPFQLQRGANPGPAAGKHIWHLSF